MQGLINRLKKTPKRNRASILIAWLLGNKLKFKQLSDTQFRAFLSETTVVDFCLITCSASRKTLTEQKIKRQSFSREDVISFAEDSQRYPKQTRSARFQEWLKQNNIRHRKFSKIHFRVWVSTSKVVDVWPTTGNVSFLSDPRDIKLDPTKSKKRPIPRKSEVQPVIQDQLELPAEIFTEGKEAFKNLNSNKNLYDGEAPPWD